MHMSLHITFVAEKISNLLKENCKHFWHNKKENIQSDHLLFLLSSSPGKERRNCLSFASNSFLKVILITFFGQA